MESLLASYVGFTSLNARFPGIASNSSATRYPRKGKLADGLPLDKDNKTRSRLPSPLLRPGINGRGLLYSLVGSL